MNDRIKNPILESVYNYYNDGKNYLNESINEEGLCAVVDDNMFGDLMDMVQKGIYEEVENGHIIIPTMGSYTFHITPGDECYLDDERGNEHEVQIDRTKLQQLLQSINTPQYRMVSEKKDSIRGGESYGDAILWHLAPGTPEEQGLKDAHTAAQKVIDRRRAEKEDALNNPSLQDRRNDPEYMNQVNDYWNDRRENMAEPHGFGTSGTKSLFPLEEMEDNSVYDLANDEKGDKANFAARGAGYINEDRLHKIVSETINKILK